MRFLFIGNGISGKLGDEVRMKLKLVDETGKIIRNANTINLSVELYTSSNPPRKLEMNTAGGEILYAA